MGFDDVFGGFWMNRSFPICRKSSHKFIGQEICALEAKPKLREREREREHKGDSNIVDTSSQNAILFSQNCVSDLWIISVHCICIVRVYSFTVIECIFCPSQNRVGEQLIWFLIVENCFAFSLFLNPSMWNCIANLEYASLSEIVSADATLRTFSTKQLYI